MLDRVLLNRIASVFVVDVGRLRRCDTFRVNRCQPAKSLFESLHRLVFAGGDPRQMPRRLADVRVPEPVLNGRERDAMFWRSW